MSDDVEKLSFEQAFQELEAIVQRLEEGNLALEEAIALYQRGVSLARCCGQALDTAELQVRQLAALSNQQQLGMFLDDQAG